MDQRKKIFVAGKQEEKQFQYIGFKCAQSSDGITINQSDYQDQLDARTIDPQRAAQKSA